MNIYTGPRGGLYTMQYGIKKYLKPTGAAYWRRDRDLEMKTQHSYKNVKGQFIDACDNCLKQVKTYRTKKMSKADLKYMKDLCIDCANQNCKFYISAKKLKLSNAESLKSACETSLRRAERIKQGNYKF